MNHNLQKKNNRKLMRTLLVLVLLALIIFIAYNPILSLFNNIFSGTRVFQIGFNKTGTSSLCAFLNDNGIKSVHYDDGALADDIWKNYLNNKPLISKKYNKHIGFFDMENINATPPIYIAQTLLQELDMQYPGSKFILNTRNKQAWIKSRCAHMMNTGISYQKQIAQKYNMSDAAVIEKWSQEWDEHHKYVITYFQDRPNDLLVFNIETDTPEKLQQFLKEHYDLDTRKYGHLNKTVIVDASEK